ncbi:hypothetical protein EMIHUDRAFT_461330 [Emiliania huxleyi CCMP1516]|uniref:Major facilitator superfamily (MFS) profile domain-containing protein n=2 Tax=Emiliania huxleyi TaxID=2903 RepID=A0A0D3J3M1_EMIH1|nr:hypothetical protein EMIHUDRAFT_461330 [Emiliania huxleyi CCMP1516]EOD18106.1 hypothetical protein EMIHUDRAFT_461330 [Emiliania huxleyi CCMP1516]|eukprot:XP_005770535.1 hypothetical protein EMIHUDRAFT_461330 [Emiliania huxleyi CCMP1516]
MRVVLEGEGLLASGCVLGEERGGRLFYVAGLCKSQELRLGLTYTIASWAAQGGRLFAGLALDACGCRVTVTVSLLLCALGTSIVALSIADPAGRSEALQQSGLTIGFFMLALGGSGVSLSLQSVAALFPAHRSLVTTALTGALQLSSGVYVLFELLQRAGASVLVMLLVHAGVCLCFAAGALLAWPASRRATRRGAAPVAPRRVGSRQYALLVLIFTVHLLQCQFLLGNVGTQLDEKGDDGTARITFSACLSLTILVSPLVGHFIDRFGFAVSFAVINSIFLAISVLLLLPSLAAQYVMAVLNAISRVSLWSCFFSYTGATFSFYHFGKLAGGGLLLAATVSLLQFPLLDLTLGPFEGDFTFVNALFAAMSCALYPAIFWLARIEARRLTEEIAVAASKPPDLPSSVETI